MKKLWFSLLMVCSACTNAPKISSFFHDGNSFGMQSITQNAPPMTTVSMLLPLSGKHQQVGLSMQNGALMALRKNEDSPVKLLFFDTKGTSEGAVEAYRWANAQNTDIVLGPVFSAEVSALSDSANGILSYTSDSTVLTEKKASMAVLISDQVEQMVRYACEMGQLRLGAIGPESKVGEIVMNTLDKAVQKCPGMSLQKFALYGEKDENMTPAVLKILPPIIDSKKKDLTPEEQEILATPMQERVEFDNLFVFEEGIRLSQLMAILAFYDVTPDIIPIYTLASVKTLKDKMLNGVYFMDLPEQTGKNFDREYQQIFGSRPPQLASLSYDSVDWIAQKANVGVVHLTDLQLSDAFYGSDGLIRLNQDGTNNRAMRLVQKKNRSVIEVKPAPVEFESSEQPMDFWFTPTMQSTDLTSEPPLMSPVSPEVFE
ncbi:MAG: penicillin-binding protein activator [Alphaproteobacteria bacterium]|nr:penicillin-binding protein activator [Alphaproteobacteria bacterium]